MPDSPEQRARRKIDAMLTASGWTVQTKDQINLCVSLGVAIAELTFKTGEPDYTLFVDSRAIGTVEAKPEGDTLTGVEEQSAKYVSGVPFGLPAWKSPLPFSYESTGAETFFTNRLDPDPCSRRVFSFHRPAALLAWVQQEKQLVQRLREFPTLAAGTLWPAQIQAINSLENSFAKGRPRALIQMATGSGKTYTAVNFIYRLVKYAGAKRVLFLVDRGNLGRQTLKEFQQFVSPVNNYKFTEEYIVQHLSSNSLDKSARVVIGTIQRIYSMLKGEKEPAPDLDDLPIESAATLFKEPVPVEYNPDFPIEEFDFIITDECHRSIYNLWRQVLEYFDASLIGLTATPSKQTFGFFQQNLVMEYNHEKAVADGVNVGCDIYRINTAITQGGSKVEARFIVDKRDRQTRKVRWEELDEVLVYGASDLDRDVVAPDLGRGWVWSGELPECVHQNHVFRARLRDSSNSPKFISYYGNSAGQGYFYDQGKHTTNLASINLTKLGKLPIPLPPPDEQRQIVAEIEKQFTRLEAGVAALRRVQANLKRYRAAVLKAACEGKLVPTEAKLARTVARTIGRLPSAGARVGRVPSDGVLAFPPSESNSHGIPVSSHRDATAANAASGDAAYNVNFETGEQLLQRILTERRKNWEESNRQSKISNRKYSEPAAPDTANLPPLPEGWTWCMSDAVFSFITSGSRGWAEFYSDSGPIFLRIGNLEHEDIRLDVAELQHVSPPKGAEGARTVVQPNDILISITADVGMVGLVPDRLGEAYINQHVALARPLPIVNPAYIAYFLCASEGGWGVLKKLQRGATKVGLGLDDIRAVPIPLPPLAEQTRIVAEVERRLSVVEEVEDMISANLQRAARLRESILKKVFCGDL